ERRRRRQSRPHPPHRRPRRRARDQRLILAPRFSSRGEGSASLPFQGRVSDCAKRKLTGGVQRRTLRIHRRSPHPSLRDTLPSGEGGKQRRVHPPLPGEGVTPHPSLRDTLPFRGGRKTAPPPPSPSRGGCQVA